MKRDIPVELIRKKMRGRSIELDIEEHFLRMVRQVVEEKSDYVPLDGLCAPTSEFVLDPTRDDIQELTKAGKELLRHVVVIKLNGGRATTMGGRVPKGILKAKDGLTYLEIILTQMDACFWKWGVNLPLIFMNSFFTNAATARIIAGKKNPPRTFIQNQVPRLIEDSLAPLDTGTDEDWAPPGHGDIYLSLKRSGILQDLMRNGFRWAFISNLDNLAACVDPWIPALMENQEIEFLLEVTDRTESDRKGGTLVLQNNRLDLLEIAQVNPAERDLFMDIRRFQVFNTNNVWVDLLALDRILNEGELKLPLIRNRKNIAGRSVIQLETAMGSAIGSFPGARGLRVGRDRFFPTKKTSDLFVLQSDACILDTMARIRKNPSRAECLPLRPDVFFSSNFVDSPDHLLSRFEDSSSISLVNAHSLEVFGSAFFGRDIAINGRVEIKVPDGTVFHIPKGTSLTEGKYP